MRKSLRGRVWALSILLALPTLPQWSNAQAVGAMSSHSGATARTNVSITDFGAVADNKTLNTAAIQKAIKTVSDAGGGMVIVPPGTFMTGPIQLLSNVELHLEEGSLLQFSKNFDDFPLVFMNFEGKDTVGCLSPITADNQHNISITGPGIVDGNGQAWRPLKKDKTDSKNTFTKKVWDDLVKSGGYVKTAKGKQSWYPSKSAADNFDALGKLRDSNAVPKIADYVKFRDLLRPNMIKISNCQNVTLDGPTFRNSPAWNIHILLSDNVTLHHVTSFNYIWAQNGDGMDLDSCRDVNITDCTVSAGDDGICIKSGKDEEGRKRGRPTENVMISNCTVNWAHGGVVIGSEMSGGVRNITVNNCTFDGTDAGLRFKTRRGRGAVVENVQVNNIEMKNIKGDAILFDTFYGGVSPLETPEPKEATTEPTTAATSAPTTQPTTGPTSKPTTQEADASDATTIPTSKPVDEGTPCFRQFYIRNINCDGAKRSINMRGLPEMFLQDITLEKIRINSENGAIVTDADGVTLRDIHIRSKWPPAMLIQNVTDLSMDHVDASVLPKPATQPTTAPTKVHKKSKKTAGAKSAETDGN